MPERRMAEILASHATVKIATSGGPVSPWVAAAFFAEDGLFSLELLIEARGATLANMQADPRVAIMIEDGDAMRPFAQAQGLAVIEDGATRELFAAHIAAKTPSSARMVALPGLVPVRLRIQRWRVTDVAAGWLPAREVRRPDAADATGAGSARQSA